MVDWYFNNKIYEYINRIYNWRFTNKISGDSQIKLIIVELLIKCITRFNNEIYTF